MSGPRRVRAFAPASIGNFAAGFDLLGGALAPLDGSLLGDQVCIEAAPEDTFRMEGPFAPMLAGLAAQGRQNLVLGAYALYRERLAVQGLACGPFAITLEKRLPLNSGMGSSSSSIVATLAGLQAMCGEPLGPEELLALAAKAEGIYSGASHWDNVAPSLLGGLQLLVPGAGGSHGVRRLPWPEDLVLAVIHPDHPLPTAVSRAALPAAWSLGETVGFAENLAGLVQALHSGDRGLLARCLKDPLAEPHRARLVPGFGQAKAAALEAGALGCSLSGSGPSVFAVAGSPAQAAAVCAGIAGAFAQAGLCSQSWLCALDPVGARILPWS